MSLDFVEITREIAAANARSDPPPLPLTYEGLEAAAHKIMPAAVLANVAGGAGNERTQRLNTTAFNRWGVYPRILRDVSRRDLATELFGVTFPTPLMFAPVAMIGQSASDGHGDIAVAKAAAQTGIPMIHSTLTVDPMETVAAELGNTPGMFQFYVPGDRELAESFLLRAERAGYCAVVVTVDVAASSWRPRDLAAGNAHLALGQTLSNYFTDPVFLSRLKCPPEQDLQAAVAAVWQQAGGGSLSWADIAWIRSVTKLPLIIKGVLHPDDVRRSLAVGADAVYCSTHGGRQANFGVSSVELLPGVVAAAAGAPVIFDSGVRSGDHIVKALALGARAVAIGRPYVWGLALAGADGAAHVMHCLLAELDSIMGVSGYASVAELTPEALVDRSFHN